jgi:hypothetical protein
MNNYIISYNDLKDNQVYKKITKADDEKSAVEKSRLDDMGRYEIKKITKVSDEVFEKENKLKEEVKKELEEGKVR